MNNIVLIGMMGCGKTTCANLLHRRLGRPVADTDALIVERQGRSISDIFAAEGEGYFRDLETAVARELAEREGLIIATGGGLPLREENMQALKATGTVFWLCRDPADTFASESMEGRPLAQDGRAAFLARFQQRAPIYEAAADFVIRNFSSPEQTVGEILACLAD